MWESGYYGYLLDYLLWWVVLATLFLHTWCFIRFVPTRFQRTRLVGGNVLVTICLLTFIGLIGETYLRFLSTATDSFGASLTCKRWHAAFVRVNSLGHRDVEWTVEKPSGVRRIAFVGDSFTYGWGIDDPRNRMSDLIQVRFDHVRPRTVQVMNVAWNAWDTQEELKWIRRMIDEYSIDEVVLCYLPNDIEQRLPIARVYDPSQPPRSALFRTSSSFLLDYFYHRLIVPRVSRVASYFDLVAEGYADASVWEAHRHDLEGIISVCRQAEVDLRVVLLPFLRTRGEKYDPKVIHGQVAALFERHHVPVVDLLPTVRGHDPDELVVSRADHHPNERANALFAEAVWKSFYEPSIDRP